MHHNHEGMILHRNGGASMLPTYGESIRVGWTILWRGMGSLLLLLMLINRFIIISFPEFLRASPSWSVVLFPITVTALIGAFGIMPWLVRRLCATSYPGFRLQLTHEPPSSKA